MPNHSGGLWISLHTSLHLLQTCPYWLPKSEQKVNSKIHGTTCGFLSLGWERDRFSPKPAEPHARFHQPRCSHHSTSSFNLSALTKRQTLRKFYIWTDKKMKHLRSLSRLWVSHTSSNKKAACSLGLSRNCPVSTMHHISTAGPGEAAGSAGGCTARSALQHSIASQASKMIIDFILIGLSAMSQFSC